MEKNNNNPAATFAVRSLLSEGEADEGEGEGENVTCYVQICLPKLGYFERREKTQ